MSNPVVTHQPGAGGYGTNVQTGEWSTGLCSCFNDCLICALGFFCPAGLSCYTAHKYGENFCLGCVPGGMTAMRTHMRLTYGIQVGVSDLSLTLVKDGARVFVFSEVVSLTQIFSHFLIQGWTFRLLNLCCNSLTNREQYATMPLWSFAADFAKCAGWLGKSASEMEKCLFNEIYIVEITWRK
uniref:PLAC8 like 1 n=1 Tax=Oryzias latipes TaxID=8090 RepID=A0A3B3IGP5_ORYLA